MPQNISQPERIGRKENDEDNDNGDNEDNEDTSNNPGTDSTSPAPSKTDCCPECEGDLIDEGGEVHCTDCGLVSDDSNIDHGPEWRAFNEEDRQRKSRVGSPTTKTLHDKGLATKIGWESKSNMGEKPYSAKKRAKFSRLRTWNKRSITKTSRERTLKAALSEVNRMASALGIPDDVREIACTIYRRATENDLIRGRSIEGMSTAALLSAARMSSIPCSLTDVERVTRVSRRKFTRAFTYLQKELSLPVEPPEPMNYLPRISSDLDVSDQTNRTAEDLTIQLQKNGAHSGKDPKGWAAAAIYLADKYSDQAGGITQQKISAVSDVTPVTIRDRKEEFKQMILEGDIESNLQSYLMPNTSTRSTEDIEITDTETFRHREGAESQADTFVRAIRLLAEKHGLLDVIHVPYRPSDSYTNAWMNTDPDQPFGESHGYWRRVSDDCYLQAKMNSETKKERIRHFAEQVGVEAKFEGW